jgi:IS30 family transposase
MRHAREVLRLKFASVSTHEIARRLGLARSTVRETLKRAETAGLEHSPLRHIHTHILRG